MSMHHFVETSKGKIEYYLNPEYIYATQQMWIIKFIKNEKRYYKHYFFHRNYKPQEIKAEIIEWVENNL